MNPREIFVLGHDYHKVASDLIEKNAFEEPQTGDSEEDNYWFVPSVVNMVFASELYLKALLVKSNNFKPGHDLKKLFKAINPQYKEELLTLMEMPIDEFEENLLDIKDAFTQWRYVFEPSKKRLDLIFLEKFTCNIQIIANRETNSKDISL